MNTAVESLLATLPARRSELGDWNSIARIGRAKPLVVVPDDIDSECYYGSPDARQLTRKVFKQHFATPGAARHPEFVIGALGTSNVLMKDTELLRQWKTAVRHITHVEMELGGAYIAACHARPNAIPLLSVRGISDVVGFRRSDEWTLFACDAAASFLFTLLKTLPHEAFEITSPGPGRSLHAALARLPSACQRVVNILVSVLSNFCSQVTDLLDGAVPPPSIEAIVNAFAKSSGPLISRTVDLGDRIPRPELDELETRFSSDSGRVLCVLGSPGSGKTALLALLARNAASAGVATLAIKADLLPAETPFESWGRREIGIEISAVDAIRIVASRGRVLVVIDQLDALSSIVAVSSNLFNSVLDFIRECSEIPNVSVVCSCRGFDYVHDVRFADLDAEVIELSLPRWEDIAKYLSQHGLGDSAHLPNDFREILRTPQHLRIYLDRFNETGRSEGGRSYHIMLDDLWARHVVNDQERNLLDSLTEFLMKTEALWAPTIAFEKEMPIIEVLKAKGILEAQGSRIGFKHQTLLEHSKARLFTKTDRSFSEYVLKHQTTLQVRPTVWAVLQYLREARPDKYRVEIENLFAASTRRHLRYLLIEFLARVRDPEDFEKVLLGNCIADADDRIRVLIGIRGNDTWFHALRKSHFPVVMGGALEVQWPMIGVINDAWEASHDDCLAIIETYWFPDPEKDRLTERVLRETDKWGAREIELACTLIRRTKDQGDRLFWAEQLVNVVSASNPESAPRLFIETMNRLAQGTVGDSNQQTSRMRSPLESTRSWYELPAVAAAAPLEFLRVGWPWFVEICELYHRGHSSSVLYRYEGYCLSLDDEQNRPEASILSAYLAAVEETAKINPSAFVEITKASWVSDSAVVHRIIIRGLMSVLPTMPEVGIEYLAGDQRRFGLGPYGDRESDSIDLIHALAPLLTVDQLRTLESQILSWSRYRADEQLCDNQQAWDREARLRLLSAIPPELLSPNLPIFLARERIALPSWDRKTPRSRSGFVREVPPMTQSEMVTATENRIVDVIRQAPAASYQERERTEVAGGWEVPGGPNAAGRELSQLNKENPHKVSSIILRLVKHGIEGAASAAFQGLSESTLADCEILAFARSLIALQPSSEQLRQDLAYVLYRRAKQPDGIPNDLCAVMSAWIEDAISSDGHQLVNQAEEQDAQEDGSSVLWGTAGRLGLRAVDSAFWLLLAISHGYLCRRVPAYVDWLSETEKWLDGNLSERTWAHYCSLLSDVRFAGAERNRGIAVIIALFAKFPDLQRCQEGALLIANVSDLLPSVQLKEMLNSLRTSKVRTVRQAYGELVTLVAFRDEEHKWAREELETVLTAVDSSANIDESVATGIAYAVGNLWDEPRVRSDAARTLSRLIPVATDKSGKAIATVFWAKEDFAADSFTDQLLDALIAHPESLRRIPVSDLVPHLVSLAPYKRNAVLLLCQSILKYRNPESDLFEIGPQLVKIAMTLQRFPETQDGALTLFEELLRLGHDDAFRVLRDIDIRPASVSERPQRERRRRRRRER